MNRVLMNGKPSSSVVFDKLNMVSGLENVGIVATYSPNTYQKMVEGTIFLMKKNVRHLEINICMGNVGKFENDKLIQEYSKTIELYLNRYEKGDFSCTYVILDAILRKLFERNNNIDLCIYPYKITYDGKIKSCDRISDEKNGVIVSVSELKDKRVDLDKFHYCIEHKNEICCLCSYRKLCTPCNVYIDKGKFKSTEIEENSFCVIMKTLINKAEDFYVRNKNNLKVVLYFNRKICDAVKKGKYIMKACK